MKMIATGRKSFSFFFGFELTTVIVNDGITRKAITKNRMQKFMMQKCDNSQKFSIEKTAWYDN